MSLRRPRTLPACCAPAACSWTSAPTTGTFPCWRLRWLAHALATPSSGFGFFNGNIFHPEPLALAYSDAMLVEGAIAAPLLGGYLLAIGLPPTRIFLSACLFALIAAAATALLVFRGSRVEHLGVEGVSPGG